MLSSRFRNHLIVAAGFGVLAVIGTITNSSKVVAQQGPPNGLAVNIVNPVPVPVTGSLNITGSTKVEGTVASTQSGAWSVGITNPVIINDASQPFQVQGGCVAVNAAGCGANLVTVPSGKRAVIEYVSVESFLPAGNALTGVLTLTLAGTTVDHFIRSSEPTAIARAISIGQELHLYADPGSIIQINVGNGAGPLSNQGFNVSLSGHFVNLP
jgi:hypothetical protein